MSWLTLTLCSSISTLKTNNKKGEDYEPESLKVMMASLDRHLKNKGCTLSIVRDREFSSSKEVLEEKAKQLRLAGRGKRPNKARQVSEEEEEILWKSGKLGGNNPESLIQTDFLARFCSLQTLKTLSKMLLMFLICDDICSILIYFFLHVVYAC